MIKIKLRKNLLYLIIYYLSWYIRKIFSMIIDGNFPCESPFLFLFMMNLGEIFGGLSLYLYQNISLKRKKELNNFDKKLIHKKNYLKSRDGMYKKIFLLFLAAFFDFMEFIIADFYLPKIDNDTSSTLDLRLSCITTIVSSLIYIYALRIKTGKHQTVSSIIMGSCLFLTFILEMIYKRDGINFGNLIYARILVLAEWICVSYTDCIERYLVDVDFLNPFRIVMFEGIFELILGIALSINRDPLKDIKYYYNKENKDNSIGKFILFIFLLFMHLICSAFVNAYKVYCNVIYSSMARSLMDYFMTPAFIIYYFIASGDFNDNYFYFFISLLISIIVDFFSCVFNEYIMLFFCGLHHDTKDEIISRALSIENIPTDIILNDINSIDDDEFTKSNDNNQNNKEVS